MSNHEIGMCRSAYTFTPRVPHGKQQSALGVMKMLEDWCLSHVFYDFRVCMLCVCCICVCIAYMCTNFAHT